MSAVDQSLMAKIRSAYGVLLEQTCKASSVPPAFLAALIANESGGDPNAKRFEGGVLASLWEVLLARKANFGSISRAALLDFIWPSTVAPFTASAGILSTTAVVAQRGIPDSLLRLDGLATSHGLTQVMGYEAIAFHLPDFLQLRDPGGELSVTLKMLADFAQRFGLDLAGDFAQLFDCWNTGRPHAQTADPQYIPKGLERMKIYADMTASA